MEIILHDYKKGKVVINPRNIDGITRNTATNRMRITMKDSETVIEITNNDDMYNDLIFLAGMSEIHNIQKDVRAQFGNKPDIEIVSTMIVNNVTDFKVNQYRGLTIEVGKDKFITIGEPEAILLKEVLRVGISALELKRKLM